MIDHTKDKSNRELLEAAKLFKFQYGKKIIKIEYRIYADEECVMISCSGLVWNRSTKCFESVYLNRSHVFRDIYEALETVRSLLK